MIQQTLRVMLALIFAMAQIILVRSDTIAPFAGDFYLGDGLPPTQANLYYPNGIAIDPINNLVYIADYANQIIRVVNRTSNILSTFAGTHSYSGFSGDGKF
jgi:DNA-binding beta-propeller fold protein YncE